VFPAVMIVLAVTAVVYIRGWCELRSRSTRTIQSWHAGSFLFGLLAIWLALASPVAAYDQHFLTVHMIQHLLLMSIAAPLILLGQPLIVLTNGLPSRLVSAIGPMLSRPRTRQLGTALVTPVWCWLAATMALVVWHVPAVLTLTMQSNAWHVAAKASFVVTGLLFWWPVVQPWPSVRGPRWSTVLYLFLAMLPCDILAAFLVFSERIAYAAYVSMPGHTSLSVLEDQAFAGALMWTVVTLVYLTAGTIVSTRLLSPRALHAV
jgi:putative membrane protein